ncbi:hypothetical protein ACOZ4I_04155 [Haloarcula salina]|uniref:hypothetical protein n=1 Tax=Haloarcula salina TaxID=1429914 RepID=UPI003C70419E
MADSESRREFLRRVVLVIGGCTIGLTAAFVGVLAVLSGEIQSVSSRVPWYLVGGALLFVATIVLLDENDADGRTIIVSALVVSVVGFGLLTLAVEGIRFAIMRPELVFVSQLVLYLFAAGLIGTGVGYWALRHWREFSTAGP